MELTRRDAVGALAAAGVVVSGAFVADNWNDVADRWGDVADGIDEPVGGDDTPTWDAHAVETTVAVANAVYPSQLENVDAFVGTYVLTRSGDDPAYRQGMADAVATLDAYTEEWEDAQYAALDPADAEDLLHAMGVDDADPDPTGSDPERVRFYLVNELLYALYTSDTGGELVGIENPQGHPGGTDSYQRGPERDETLSGQRAAAHEPAAPAEQDDPAAPTEQDDSDAPTEQDDSDAPTEQHGPVDSVEDPTGDDWGRER